VSSEANILSLFSEKKGDINTEIFRTTTLSPVRIT
jgi:hypothetical protein